jgi:hypothetical protein
LDTLSYCCFSFLEEEDVNTFVHTLLLYYFFLFSNVNRKSILTKKTLLKRNLKDKPDLHLRMLGNGLGPHMEKQKNWVFTIFNILNNFLKFSSLCELEYRLMISVKHKKGKRGGNHLEKRKEKK